MHYSASKNSFYPEPLRGAYERSGRWPDDAIKVTDEEYSKYGEVHPPEGMQRGASSSGYPIWVDLPPISLDDLASRKRQEIERSRKAAEDDGVVVQGIRYSGSRDNRTEILQALQSADDSGIEAFPRWKDSDNTFHFNHSVADVRAAIREIATRRNELINQEGELSAQIDAALEAEDREGLEAIEWSNAG